MATKKKCITDWAFLHIKVNSPDLNFDELKQFLEFQFSNDNGIIFCLREKREFFLVEHDLSGNLENMNRETCRQFYGDQITSFSSPFNETGIDHFLALISSHIESDDVPSQIAFKRLSQAGNSIMVLDDDVMVTRQLQRILDGFGNVVSLHDHSQLIDVYKQCAPDILFLDIHLRDGVRGPDLIDALYQIDPYAYIVIISADTAETTILALKGKPVKGFAVKPFDRNKLFKIVTNAPTFTPRADSR
jgi:CheY-like chemotaxis protein